MTIFQRDEKIFKAPKISTRVPGVPLTVYSEKDLMKIIKESRINPEGCTTRDEMIARIKNPGEYKYPDDWVDPVELAAQKEAAAARAAAEAAKPNYSKLGRQVLMLPLMSAFQSVDWSAPGNQNMLLILAALVMTPVYFCYEWTLAAIESKRDDGRVYEPDIKGAESIAEADGSVSVQQYDRSKAKEAKSQFFTIVGGAVFWHVCFGHAMPIAGACFTAITKVWDCKPVHIHLRGKVYERPWGVLPKTPTPGSGGMIRRLLGR